MTKAQMNAKLQSRTGSRSDDAKLAADAEFSSIRAQLQALPRTPEARTERQRLIAMKYDRELQVLAA
jgi:hypothetical protein